MVRDLRDRLIALTGALALVLMAGPCGAFDLDAHTSEDLAAPELDLGGTAQAGGSSASGVAGDRARIDQRGQANEAVIQQGEGGAQQAAILQRGNGHSATILQGDGAGNQAVVFQEGLRNDARIEQRGSRNKAAVVQSGRGFEAEITQVGDGNEAYVVQPPMERSLSIRQDNGSSVSVRPSE